MSESISKSWFCVFNNPEEHGYIGTPQQIVDKILQQWIDDNPQRTCAITYCISADGLKHCHAVLEDTKAMRFSSVKKVYPLMHIEPTKGSKSEAEDYINKRGKFQEKGEKMVCSARHGEIKGFQGQRKDLEIIEEMIGQGRTPNEIMDMSLQYRRYDKMIKEAYYRKRFLETPVKRNIAVYWHVGLSGTGKSHTFVELAEKFGEDYIYIVTDYERGGFDKYSGEECLFIDEFRGQMRYNQLLTIFDCYKVQIGARYTNALSLWNEIHITSVYPPEKLYHDMIHANKSIDTFEQLCRRISFMVYHYKEGNEYFKFQIPMSEYVDYETLVKLVHNSENSEIDNGLFKNAVQLDINTPTPFDD